MKLQLVRKILRNTNPLMKLTIDKVKVNEQVLFQKLINDMICTALKILMTCESSRLMNKSKKALLPSYERN